MGILEGRKPFVKEVEGEKEKLVLLKSFYEVNGFHLKAFNELDAYLEEPDPYLELDLSSAAVIARVMDTNSILLVEFVADDRERRVEFPAGKVDLEFDTSITDTAKREFEEETGGIIDLLNLQPLSVRYLDDGLNGLQFYTEIPNLEVEKIDELGRGYLTPPIGTDKGRVSHLITEPLNVFLDPEQTLLRYSQNQWAVDDVVRVTLGMHILKVDEQKKSRS